MHQNCIMGRCANLHIHILPHHRCTRRHRSPTPHHIDTIAITRPNTASNINTEDRSTQLKKGKSRYPAPLPTKFFSFPTYSDTEDPADTASEVSTAIHSQDEDDSSTDYNTISPPRNYHIPMTPPKTCKAMLPRPSHIPVLKMQNTTKNQQNKNIPTTQKVRPSLKSSCIPVSNYKKQEPVNQPKVQQIISSLPRPCKGNITKQQQTTSPTMQTRETPLLPTPLAQSRQTVSPRPSTFNNSRKPTFSRPSPFIMRPSPINNYRFHQQSYIPRPHTPRFNNQQPPLLPSPPCQHQSFITSLYQQPQGHYTQQVSLPLYVPILILTQYNQINSILAHQTILFNRNQY